MTTYHQLSAQHAIDQMSDAELRSVYLGLILDYNYQSMSKVAGWRKVSHLFDREGGTAMNPYVRQAFVEIAARRLVQ